MKLKTRFPLLYKPTPRIFLALAFVVAFLPNDWVPISEALAAENKPHQHGAGELNVVLDGHDLLLELRLPADDVVGFEHEPSNAKQKAIAQQALNDFAHTGAWFTLSPDAGCEIESAQASVVGMALSTSEEAGGDHQHESHDHGKEVGHKHEHEHEHEGRSGGPEAHSDFDGTLAFHCANPAALTQLTGGLFKLLSRLTELAVQYVGPEVQTSAQLTRKNNTLRLIP